MSESAEVKLEESLEEGTTRPKRSRQAPLRFEPSQHAAQHRRIAGNKRSSNATSTRLEEQEAKLASEIAYLAQYNYDHVGQVTQEKSPSIWIDVPDVQPHWVVLDAITEKSKRRRRPTKDDAERPKKSKVSKKRQSLSRKNPSENVEYSSHRVEIVHPFQDALTSPGDRVNVAGILEDHSRGNRDAATLESEIASQIAPASSSSRPISAPNSPSPTSFVDASEDLSFPLRLTNAADSFLSTTLQINTEYHPEMRLSHDVRESSLRAIPIRSSAPVTSKEVKKRKESFLEHSLFLGSEGEDEEDQGNGDRCRDEKTPRSAIPTALLSKGQLEERKDSESPNRKQKDAAARLITSQTAQAGSSNNIEIMSKGSRPRKNGKEKKIDTLQVRKKRKRRSQSLNGNNYGVVQIPSSSDDDLVSNLNIENFVKSTGGRQKKDQRTKQLQRLRKQKEKAERKRQGQSSGESSESESESNSDSDSTESIDEQDFIVDDEDMPSTSRSKSKSHIKKHTKSKAVEVNRSAKEGLNFSPPPLSIPKYRAYVEKLSKKQKLEEYIIWIVSYALDIPLEKDNETRLKAVRADLQDKFRMNYQSLLTQANRKQFTWYLIHFPQFERRLMTRAEKDANIGCHACRKKSQRCEYAFTFFGDKYNEKDLTRRDDDNYTSSALSTNGEDLKIISKDSKKNKLYTFYLGETCAQFASVKHKIYHWERRVLNEVVKLQEFKELKRKDSDDIGGEHIDTVVQAYLPKLLKRYNNLEGDARDLVTKSTTSKQRLIDRWDFD